MGQSHDFPYDNCIENICNGWPLKEKEDICESAMGYGLVASCSNPRKNISVSDVN